LICCGGTNGLLGYAQKGPYDAIHVGAAARTIPPALLEQLASPGRMIIPVGSYSQRFVQVDKDAQGKITQEDLFGVVVRASCCVSERVISRFSWGAVCATYRQTSMRCGDRRFSVVPSDICCILYHRRSEDCDYYRPPEKRVCNEARRGRDFTRTVYSRKIVYSL
jgi:hypothetical protein